MSKAVNYNNIVEEVLVVEKEQENTKDCVTASQHAVSLHPLGSQN